MAQDLRTDRIADPWGPRTPHAAGAAWPGRIDQYLEDGVGPDDVERWVQSCCVLCANGCAMDVAVKGGRIVGVRGRVLDRVNRGRLGPKGLFGWQANNSPDRLTRPLIRRDGELVETDWETAMGAVVERSRDLLGRFGPLTFGFYTTGQFFIEDYYTQAILVRGGIGSPHMDGNTRLCTATAATSLKETFGSDGQPGSFTDIEHCDTLLHVGHNPAENQTVFWMRVLDRLRGDDPPRMVVIDPRPTPTAREATVHLSPRPGTNIPLLNALQQQLIANGWIDRAYIDAHTIGFEKLRDVVMPWTPERAAEVCGVPAERVREAARILGTAKRLTSTALQGVYQSMGATATACQVNNLNLLRGMIGKPGCGIMQMNGQPSAQNNRETGCDGDLSAFRNWANFRHVEELARLWNVDPITIPHWAPPSHALEIFRHVEEGSIRFLWITATNPAVSLPHLGRIRSILDKEGLFLVVQDIFLTETARFADVVLPAAAWGEKTGTFTNPDRTVHLTEKAVEPPGEARRDMDIFIDYARRMGFKDRDGQPLIKWSDPEGAFDAWREVTRGRPCDYSGMSYAKLRGASGIQWPCNDAHPDGTERLFADGLFHTQTEYTQSYGHDLNTGVANTENEHRALGTAGRAILHPALYFPPHEPPSDEYPFVYSTGRNLYHFHTRTKTGRAPQLADAAPDAWVEMAAADADRLGIAEGDLVRIESRRGMIEVPVRVSGIREGVVFVPFHFGYFDTAGGGHPDGRARAANELTIVEWDPVSKQPNFKVAAVRVTRVAGGKGPSPAPTTTASAPVRPGVPPTQGHGRADATSRLESL